MILIFCLWERTVTIMIISRKNLCRISPVFLRMEYYLLYIFNDRRNEYQKSPRWKANNSGSCWQMLYMHQCKNAISCIHVSDNLSWQLERSPHKSHSSVLLLSSVEFLQPKGPSLGSASNPLPLATTCSSYKSNCSHDHRKPLLWTVGSRARSSPLTSGYPMLGYLLREWPPKK